MIGHAGHPEVEGTMGQCATAGIYLVEKSPDVATLSVARSGNSPYVTQTTLSVDDTTAVIAALRNAFPRSSGPPRRHLLCDTEPPGCGQALARSVDLVLVVGSPEQLQFQPAARARRAHGVPAYLIDGAERHPRANGEGRSMSASPPAHRRPKSWCARSSRGCASWARRRARVGRRLEKVVFPMPRGLGGHAHGKAPETGRSSD